MELESTEALFHAAIAERNTTVIIPPHGTLMRRCDDARWCPSWRAKVWSATGPITGKTPQTEYQNSKDIRGEEHGIFEFLAGYLNIFLVCKRQSLGVSICIMIRSRKGIPLDYFTTISSCVADCELLLTSSELNQTLGSCVAPCI